MTKIRIRGRSLSSRALRTSWGTFSGALLVAAFALSIPLASGCESDGAGICDGAELRAHLSRASAGQTVVLGACRLTGPFVVPPGVRLEGTDAVASILVASAGGRAVTLAPSSAEATPTTLTGLSVESAAGCAGVVAMGPGAVSILDVQVRAEMGVGIAIEDVAPLLVSGTEVSGPVTPDEADTTMAPLPPFTCGTPRPGTHGIVLVAVSSARLVDSRTHGFSRFGLLSVHSEVTIESFATSGNLGAGIELWGGTASLRDVDVDGTRDGAGAVESYGVVAGGGARVTTSHLRVIGGDSYGVFQDGALGLHENLEVRDNGFAGVWTQNSDGFVLSGDETLISGNRFAGVAVLASTGARIEGATISETRSGIAISGVSTVRAADGVHVSASAAIVQDLTLQNNERVGLLVDLAGATTADVMLSRVSIDAGGAALGAIAQNGTALSGWDDEVTRLGATAVNDAMFSGALGIAAGVGPPCFPPVDGLVRGGIADLVGP